MELKEFVASPKNRELVRDAVTRAFQELEPSGIELQLGYLEPLIDLAARDEVITTDRWEEAGRFGNADLIGPILVPLVLEALALNKAEISREDVKRAVMRARSPQGRSRLVEIERAVNLALDEVRCN
ncbi:MAG TPA: hypothetical protein VGM86_04045 [Thermoanaerobaculia bacterium]